MNTIDLVVHATHEAGFKVGGIGAVMGGLLATAAYNQAVRRTILVGSMDTMKPVEMARLTAPANRLQIIYSSWHGVDQAPAELSVGLHWIEMRSRVSLLYGKRTFVGPGGEFEHEVLLVDARWADLEQANACKLDLWRGYRIESNQFEWIEEYDLVIKAAQPTWEALRLLTDNVEGERCLIAHEWMGLPLAFVAQLKGGQSWRTLYYAHEMPTVRILIEDHPGQDTRFYNVLSRAQPAGLTLEGLFGDRSGYFKHALVKRATRLDRLLAAGRLVGEELRFLGGDFSQADIRLVHNGALFRETGMEARQISTDRLRTYCQNLLGFWPDYVSTHVSRLVLSKGLWRDLAVLEHLDRLLAADGKRMAHFLLSSSEPAGREVEQVYRWEQEYGWPVVHHADNGDLILHEVPLYQAIEGFNARSRAIKVVFVNQFGWSRERCGLKMPAEMSWRDVRQGTHLEFGLSIYEPFGISQVEPLAFGAISVVSTVCGCVGFVQQAAQEAGMEHFPNLLQADFVTLPSGLQVYSATEALNIGYEVRDHLEKTNSYNVALAIRATLPTTDRQAGCLLKRGQRVSERMCWEVVARDHFLPALAAG